MGTHSRKRGDIEVISTLSELDALSEDWAQLGRQFPTPLLQHAWFMACARTLHRETDLRVVVARSAGRVVGIAPLVLHRTPPATWLALMGTSTLGEPSGLLYADQPSLDLLVDALLSMRQPLLLEKLVFGSAIDRALQHRRTKREFVIVRRTGRSCHLVFKDGWHAFQASMGTKSRAGLRTKERKAMALGGLSIDEYGASLCLRDLSPLLQRAFEVEASSWKGRAGSALLARPRLKSFFECYTASACAAGMLRVYFYRVGSNLIAMRIAVEHSRRLWFLKTGYDPAWSRVSPGVHLTMEIIRKSIESGLEGCEFLGADEAWQHAWPVEMHQYCSVLAYPCSFKGLCAGAATAVAYVRSRQQHRRSPVGARTAGRVGLP